MSRRRRGERSKETSSGATAPLELARSHQHSSASQNYPSAGKPCAPKVPKSEERPLDVEIALISRETASDSPRTPPTCLTLSPETGPDPRSRSPWPTFTEHPSMRTPSGPWQKTAQPHLPSPRAALGPLSLPGINLNEPPPTHTHRKPPYPSP